MVRSSQRRVGLPDKVDVAIVGGGVVGLSAALSLSRRGLSVALFEKGRLGGEQSTRCWGWCREFGRDARERPLAAKAMRMWRASEIAGGPLPFQPCGIVYLAHTEAQAERYTSYLEEDGPHPELARAITKAELNDLLPGHNGDWAFALRMPGDGRADPDLTIARLAAALERHGASLHAHCAALAFETSGGRITALETEHGRVGCESLIVAAGAWSSLFCRAHGVSLPQIKVVSSVMATEPVADAPATCVFGDGFSFGRQRDGGYLVGHGGAAELPLGPDVVRFARHFAGALCQEWGFVKAYTRPRLDAHAAADWRDAALRRFNRAGPFQRRRALDPKPAADALDHALRRLRRAFPAFAQARVRQSWAGAMDVTADALPVISTVAKVPGLVLGTGFSGHGYGLAPAAGEVLADLATARESDIDVTPFRLSRFFDGSRPRPGLRF